MIDKVKLFFSVVSLIMGIWPVIQKAIPIVQKVAEEFADLSWQQRFEKAVELLDQALDGLPQRTASRSVKNSALHVAHLISKSGLA